MHTVSLSTRHPFLVDVDVALVLGEQPPHGGLAPTLAGLQEIPLHLLQIHPLSQLFHRVTAELLCLHVRNLAQL